MIRGFPIIVRQLNQRAAGTVRLISHRQTSRTLTHGTNVPKTPVTQRQIKTDCALKSDFNYKILTQDRSAISSSFPSTENNNIELDDIEIDIAGKKLTVNLTWLRDSCHCPQCTHQYSRQRLFTIKDFKRHMFTVGYIQIHDNQIEHTDQICWPKTSSDEGYLQVEWADGHKSRYPLSWLFNIQGLHSKSRLDSNVCRDESLPLPEDDFYLQTSDSSLAKKSWTVSDLNSGLKPVNYEDLVDGLEFNNEAPKFINANRISDMSPRRYEALFCLTQQLVEYGLGKIINVPPERDQVLKVTRSLAYDRPTGYGRVFDVVVEPSEEINLAYSAREFDLHSDLTYRETSPGVQLLHCIRNSVDGGYSYFSDGFKAAQLLKQQNPILFEVLLRFPATFVVRDPYRDLKFRRQQPVLSLDHSGHLKDVYYSPFMLPPIGHKDDIKLFYLALDQFTQFLQSPQNKSISKMEPGDLFIFHNRRVLHGRSSYDPTTSNRFLQGCYMDWDEINCLYEKLCSHSCT